MAIHKLTFITLLACIFPLIGARRLDQIRDAHPSDFLVSSDPANAGQQEEKLLSSAEEEKVIRTSTDQLMERLSSKGTDINNPSVRYILDLYNKMESGEDIVSASGRENKEAAIAGSDVIRSLTATGKYIFLIC